MFKIFLVFSILGAVFGAPNYHNFTIVGGHDSSIAKHPSIVSLHHGNDYVCGGTLIASRYVLTAAHCITRFKSGLYIRAGSTYISDGGQVENVMDYTIYPGHSDKTYILDIAILHLSGPVSVKTAQNARLPSAGQAVPDNAQVVVAGWGAQSENGKKLATVLQEVTIPVMNLQECAGYNSKINPVTKDNFCAGVHAGGIDSCQGDSGGPAVLNGVLVGIISWGNGCGRPNSPGVYTKVSNFRKFISDYAHV